MNEFDIIKTVLDLAKWLIISAGIGIPFFASVYMLITPTHRIAASWQNFRVSRNPHKALKDRHFKHLPRQIRLWKIASFFGFFLFLWLGLKQFHLDLLEIFARLGK